jgi:signal transduction histidine kinase
MEMTPEWLFPDSYPLRLLHLTLFNCGLSYSEIRAKKCSGHSQGLGVPESELVDISRPFYRVNDARERESGGTGVGLAISNRVVRLHGGELRALNAPSRGLIMKIELPIG